MAANLIRIRLVGDNAHTAYIALPGHPGNVPGVVSRSLNLTELVKDYVGSRVHLDCEESASRPFSPVAICKTRANREGSVLVQPDLEESVR